jgi:MFS family permease
VLKNRIAVNLSFFINGFIYANWASRLPRIQELYDANKLLIGVVLFALALGAVVAMPFTGWIIIRNGSRKITLIALILYCAAVPLIPLMPERMVLTVLYFFMGIVTGVLDVAMNAQAVMVEQQYKKPIMTSFHAFFSIGMALGAGCGALFASTNLSLFEHFSIVVFICLGAVIWVRYNLVHDKPLPDVVHDGPLFRLPNAALVNIGIIAFCCMLGEGSMADWSVKYMEEVVHSDKTLAPFALTAFAAAMTVGRIFGDHVRASIGDPRLIVLGGIISTIGVAIVVFFPFEYSVITGCFFVGLGLSSIVPVTYSIAGNTKDLPSGVGLAMVTTVGYSGFLLGPPLIGFISEWKNLRFGLFVVLLLFLFMSILGFLYKSSKRS